jgi:hypothetical protein
MAESDALEGNVSYGMFGSAHNLEKGGDDRVDSSESFTP